MSSVRKKLSASEYNALAATPLPFAVIWAESDFDAFVKKAESKATQIYLEFLKEYKSTLSESNPIYNDAGISIQKARLLESLAKSISSPPDSDATIKAAALNLYAVLQRDTKDFDGAEKSFKQALALENLAPLSRASLLHNLAFTLTVKKRYDDALVYQEDAVRNIQEIELTSPIEKHVAASVYSILGNIYRKLGWIEDSKKAHAQALELWDCNVIANNAAINLSKIDSRPDLEEAENILSKYYDEAKQKQLVVTLFYSADVYIKLAGYAKGTDKFDTYIKKAEASLSLAKQAILKYKEANYVTKTQARLYYLTANLGYVQGDLGAVSIYNAVAETERSRVTENSEGKLKKFLDKFPPSDGAPFNSSRLFRQKAVVTPAADEKAASYQCK